MNRFAPLIAVMLALSSLVAASPARVAACSCAPTTAAEAEANVDIVFIGVIVDTRISAGSSPGVGSDELSFLFHVEEMRKGPARDVLVVNTNQGGGVACAPSFAVGERWLVYASVEPDERLRSFTCVPNRLMGTVLGAPLGSVRWPQEDDGIPVALVAGVAGLAALSALALIVWRRRGAS